MNLVASDFSVTAWDPEYLTGANLGHVGWELCEPVRERWRASSVATPRRE